MDGAVLACAAGLRTIELIEDGLMDNAKRMGEYLATGLDSLADEFVHVGPSHGLGLMQAIDIRRGKQGPLTTTAATAS